MLDQVADTFYVKDARQKRLLDPEEVERLQRELLAVVSGTPGAAAHAHG